MNIETKMVRREDDKNAYLKFGYELTGTERCGTRHKHNEYVLARNKDMPSYRLIAAYEKKYFGLKAQLKERPSIDVEEAIILFLILIVPGIIYLIAKNIQISNVDRYNAPIRREMNEVLKEVKPLVEGRQ